VNIKIVEIAKSFLGQKEVGQNKGPIVKLVAGTEGIPWCAGFVTYVYGQAGYVFEGLQNRLYVPYLYNWGKKRGFLTSTPEPGDIFVLRTLKHTGLVELVDGDVVHTIEGNYRNMVTRNQRDRKTLYFIRPPLPMYEGSKNVVF